MFCSCGIEGCMAYLKYKVRMKKKGKIQKLLNREATINTNVISVRKAGVARYKDEIHNEPPLQQLCRSAIIGLSQEELCFQHRISPQLYNRLLKDPEFSKAVELGKQATCRRLKAALVRKGLGYNLIEETKEPKVVALIKTKFGTKRKTALVVTKTVTKHLPPDVAAINSYLRNYDTDWKGETPQAIGQQQNNNYFPKPLTPEQVDDDTEKRLQANCRTLQRYGDLAAGIVTVEP